MLSMTELDGIKGAMRTEFFGTFFIWAEREAHLELFIFQKLQGGGGF